MKDPRLRGRSADEILKYITGTDFVTKYTVMRHFESKSHLVALEYEKLLGSANSGCAPEDISSAASQSDSSTSNSSNTIPSLNFKASVRSIATSLKNASKNAYKALMKTAYILAVDGLPFTHFKTLVNIQRSSGVALIQKCDSHQKAK